MKKQFNKIIPSKRHLQQEILACTHTMLHGSMVTLYRCCGNKRCRCYLQGKKHGPAYYLSVPGKKATQMHYLTKEAVRSPQFKPALRAFKRYWELGKKIAELNCTLYTQSFIRRK